MAKKWWILIGVCVVLFGTCIVGVIGYFFLLPQYRINQAFQRAEHAYEQGLWAAARNNYAWYLTMNQDDIETMEKYAYVCSRITSNRRRALQDTGSAYFRLAQKNPEDLNNIMRVVDHYRMRRMWADLEYVSSYFLRYSGDNLKLAYYRAMALERIGRTTDAINAYEALDYDALIADNVVPRNVFLSLAQLRSEQGFVEQARNTIETAFSTYSDDPQMHLQLANYYLLMGELDTAWEYLQNIFAEVQDDPNAHLLATQLASRRGDLDLALEHVEKALELDNTLAEAYMNMLVVYEQTDRLDEAAVIFSNIDPYFIIDFPELLLAKAELLLSIEDIDGFEDNLETYKNAYPDSFMLFEYLEARQLLLEGDAGQAARKFTIVVQSNPDFDRAQFYLALSQIQAGDMERAQTALNTYLRRRPEDERAQSLFEQAFGTPRTMAEIQAAAQLILDSEQSTATELVSEARSLMRESMRINMLELNDGLIRNLLARAMGAEPSMPDSYQSLVEWLIVLGQLEEARLVMAQALDAGVNPDELRVVQAAAASAEGNTAEALEIFKEVYDDGELNHDAVVRWANAFASSDEIDLGLDVIEYALEQEVDEHQKAIYRAEYIAILAQFADIDIALTEMENVQSLLTGNQEALAMLYEQKTLLAERIFMDDQYDSDVANVILDEVLAVDSDHINARLVRVRSMLTEGETSLEVAEQLVREVLTIEESNINALLIMVEIFNRRGQSSQALEFAERAATSAPRSLQVQLSLTDSHLRNRNFMAAENALQRILQVWPNTAAAYELQVRLFAAQGQLQQAEAALQRYRELAGDDPDAGQVIASLRSWLNASVGNWEEVENEARARLEDNPNDVVQTQALAQALMGQGRIQEAETHLRGLAERLEDNVEAWNALGQFYLSNLNQNPNVQAGLMSAASAFSRALFIMDDYVPAMRNAIEVQMRLGNTAVALSYCERLLALNPNDEQIQYQKALLLNQQPGRVNDAIQAITNAIQLSEQPDYLLLRGRLYMQQQFYERALSDFQRTNSLLGYSDARLDLNLAEAYLSMDDNRLAAQYYESARIKVSQGQDIDQDRLSRISVLLRERGAI